MNGRHRVFLSLVSILGIVSLLVSSNFPPAQAQQLVRITDFKIQTIDGKDTKEPLMAGSSYIVSFALQISKEVKDRITLGTDLKMVGDRYWELDAAYLGPQLGSPSLDRGRKEISFLVDAKEGKPVFKLTGEIPVEAVATKLPTGQFLHLKRPFLMLSLKTASINDERKMEAIDKSIENYQATLAAKRKVVEGSTGEAAFVGLIGALVKEAQAVAAKGDTDSGAALLKAIPDKGWPQPPTSNTMMYFIIGVVGLIALIFLFLMIKTRGSAGYAKGVIEDQVKKLDVVSVKAGRLGDKVLLQEINAVKEELDRISR